MIPRLGDGNKKSSGISSLTKVLRLENDSPSRGRKLKSADEDTLSTCLENDSPSRGRKK